MLEIDFIDEINGDGQIAEQLIQKLLSFAADAEGLEDGTELSVTFLDDDAIKQVNRDYRGKDQPTDVISFALEEEGEGEAAIIGADDMPRHLGDLLISVETAQRQAVDYGHSVERELGFLALHGFLHLLGYDHMTENDEKKMFGRQDEILKSFGLER
ncbi:rRNA maturation RNase YbeY [Sporosarcina sp. D27]|uniref:rRNA maturation RNase YbeY n=1 Tax=Sporosarcina sp. D27 TaxID=1382305 RepID=UPI0004715C9B|nr:rRNA maturation RNase YbeY [Sporosarcina sp. D27]